MTAEPITTQEDAVHDAVERALEDVWPLARHVSLEEVVDRALGYLEASVTAEVARRLSPDEDAAYRAGRERVEVAS